MNYPSPFQFDASQMDPELLMEMSQLLGGLSPQQLSRMQALMHNMVAGFDVRKDMEEFEKNLPPEFRQKLMTLISRQGAVAPVQVQPSVEELMEESVQDPVKKVDMDLLQARRTILRAVSKGQMPPEEAEKLLFASGEN